MISVMKKKMKRNLWVSLPLIDGECSFLGSCKFGSGKKKEKVKNNCRDRNLTDTIDIYLIRLLDTICGSKLHFCEGFFFFAQGSSYDSPDTTIIKNCLNGHFLKNHLT